MKKIAIGLGVLLLLAIVLPAMAAPAEVVKDISQCPMLNAEQQIIYGTGRYVITSSGNINLVCKAQLDPLTDLFPAKAVIWNYKNTGVTWLGIEDWQNVITPSGKVTLTAHYKA